MNYEYEIAGKEKVKTIFGDIDCTVINSFAISSVWTSYFKAYYSDDYGFVKLNDTLLNGLEVSLILHKVSSGSVFRTDQELVLYKSK